jgi:hypothetical protein
MAARARIDKVGLGELDAIGVVVQFEYAGGVRQFQPRVVSTLRKKKIKKGER